MNKLCMIILFVFLSCICFGASKKFEDEAKKEIEENLLRMKQNISVGQRSIWQIEENKKNAESNIGILLTAKDGRSRDLNTCRERKIESQAELLRLQKEEKKISSGILKAEAEDFENQKRIKELEAQLVILKGNSREIASDIKKGKEVLSKIIDSKKKWEKNLSITVKEEAGLFLELNSLDKELQKQKVLQDENTKAYDKWHKIVDDEISDFNELLKKYERTPSSEWSE